MTMLLIQSQLLLLQASRHCERNEAIQKAKKQGLDCFVANAPRNDVTVAFRLAYFVT